MVGHLQSTAGTLSHPELDGLRPLQGLTVLAGVIPLHHAMSLTSRQGGSTGHLVRYRHKSL